MIYFVVYTSSENCVCCWIICMVNYFTCFFNTVGENHVKLCFIGKKWSNILVISYGST